MWEVVLCRILFFPGLIEYLIWWDGSVLCRDCVGYAFAYVWLEFVCHIVSFGCPWDRVRSSFSVWVQNLGLQSLRMRRKDIIAQ